jgi:drug/metabolite transporter (DMT)-like permease
MRAEYLWIGVVALTWGGYPLVTRAAAQEGPRAALILMLAGLIPIVVAAIRHPTWSAPLPGKLALTQLVIAGLMMGIGFVAFYAITVSKMEASVSIPITDVSMMLVSAVGAMLFFAEPVTLQKLGGLALMLAGIALLRPQ